MMRQKVCVLQNSNAVKHFLTDANNIAYLQFTKSSVNPRNQRFDTMYNYVHIDEK